MMPPQISVFHCFNPRPSLPRGDAKPHMCRLGRYGGFNPRPSLPRGDAVTITRPRALFTVSIHAPRCRGAMHLRLCPRLQVVRFQSTPLVAEGRCTMLFSSASDRLEFQSTPLVAEGRCSSSITIGSIRTKIPHCANLLPMSERNLTRNSIAKNRSINSEESTQREPTRNGMGTSGSRRAKAPVAHRSPWRGNGHAL